MALDSPHMMRLPEDQVEDEIHDNATDYFIYGTMMVALNIQIFYYSLKLFGILLMKYL